MNGSERIENCLINRVSTTSQTGSLALVGSNIPNKKAGILPQPPWDGNLRLLVLKPSRG